MQKESTKHWFINCLHLDHMGDGHLKNYKPNTLTATESGALRVPLESVF